MIERCAVILLAFASMACPVSIRAQEALTRSPDLAWWAEIRSVVSSKARYPEHLRGPDGEGPSGTVIIKIRVDRNGKMLKAEAWPSSGVPELDQAAITAAWRADPVTPPPLILAAAEPEVVVTIAFESRP